MKLKNSFQMIDILGERAYNISTRIGGDYMLDVNMIIANNIQAELKKENKKAKLIWQKELESPSRQ